MHYFKTFNILLITLLLSNCKTNEPSADVKVAGGEVIKDLASYRDILQLTVDAERSLICTGVIVGPNALLMAAHCVKNLSVIGNFYVSFNGVKHPPKHIEYYSALKDTLTLTNEAAGRDLAIVIMKSDLFAGLKYRKIRTTPPAKEEVISIIGYGAENFEENSKSAGVLRKGTNKVAYGDLIVGVLGSMFKITERDSSGRAIFRNDAALAAPGDSGGPILDQNGEILGLATGVYLVQEKKSSSGQTVYITASKDGKPSLDTRDADIIANIFTSLALGTPGSRMILSAIEEGAKIDYPADSEFFVEADKKWLTNPPVFDIQGRIVALCGGISYATTPEGDTDFIIPPVSVTAQTYAASPLAGKVYCKSLGGYVDPQYAINCNNGGEHSDPLLTGLEYCSELGGYVQPGVCSRMTSQNSVAAPVAAKVPAASVSPVPSPTKAPLAASESTSDSTGDSKKEDSKNDTQATPPKKLPKKIDTPPTEGPRPSKVGRQRPRTKTPTKESAEKESSEAAGSIDKGQAIYKQKCAECHDDPESRSLSAALANPKAGGAKMEAAVKSLTPADQLDLGAYLKSKE